MMMKNKVVTCSVLIIVLTACILCTGCTSTPAPVTTPVPTVPTPIPITVVTGAATAPMTDPSLTGTWDLKGAMLAGGTPVIANVQVPLTFNNDGTLTGFGGCNNFNANYILTGQTTEFGKTITIEPIESTTIDCADTSDKESTYLNILQDVKTYSITNNKMILRDSISTQLSYDKV